MKQKLISSQERKKPSFVLCTCGEYAKKLFFQTKQTKHNGILAGYCRGCNKIVIQDPKMEVSICSIN